MAVDHEHLGHLLRRAGFGASAADLPALEGMSTFEALAYVLNVDDQPDDVDTKIGQPDYVNVTTRGPRSRRTSTSTTRASAGCSAWSTRGVRCRRRWRSSGTTTSPPPTASSPAPSARSQGTQDAGAQAAASCPGRRGRSRLFRQYALGNFRDLLVDVAQDPAMLVWLDGRTNTQAAAAGELRPRDHGALHARRRPLHRRRRLRGGARVHRLEPALCVGEPQHDPTATTSSSTTPTSTTPAPRRSRSRSTATAAARSRRARRAAGMQDGIDLITALAMHPETARRLAAEVLELLRQRDHAARSGVHARARPASICRTTRASGRVVRYMLHVARGSRIRRWLHALLVAGGIRRAGGQGSRAGAASRSDNTRAPLVNMGQQLFEPPNVAGWPLGQGWFSTGDDARADELRGDACRRTRSSTSPRPRPAAKDSPTAFVELLLDRLTPAPFDQAPLDSAQGVPRAPAARGPARRAAADARPRASRACSSAPPNISSCRTRAWPHGRLSSDLHPRRRRGVHASASPRRRS